MKFILKAFDVIDVREEDLQVFVESISVIRQRFVHHQLQEISKVVTSVEAYPMNLVIENESGLSYFFCKVKRLDSLSLQSAEVNAAILQ